MITKDEIVTIPCKGTPVHCPHYDTQGLQVNS